MPPTMSFEEYESQSRPSPYYFGIEAGKKKLSYFGADHSADSRNSMFAQIREKFAAACPQLVFIEGINNIENYKKRHLQEITESGDDEVIKKFGEPGFTIKLAAAAGAEFACPEPSFRQELDDLEKQNFRREEIFAHYMYRALDSMHDEPDNWKFLDEQINEFKEQTQWPDFDYSISHLRNILEGIWGKSDSDVLAHFDFDRMDPAKRKRNIKVWSVINEITRRRATFRDSYIVKKIAAGLDKNDRVFVTYGAGHAYMQEPALRELFKSFPDKEP